MKNNDFLTTPSSTQGQQWLTAVLILSLLLIFYTTLYPFDFVGASEQTALDVIARFNPPEPVEVNYDIDVPRNIVLFVPFGFALAGLLYGRFKNKIIVFMLSLMAGALVSLAVETLQTYSLLRHPSFVDVTTNGIGAGLGCVLYVIWGKRFLANCAKFVQKICSSFTIPRVTLVFLCYVTLLLWLTVEARAKGKFDTWDTSYPLLLGNEVKGHRPWRGYMQDFFIMDRALVADEIGEWINGVPATQIDADHVVAYHNFLEADAENFPPLQWQGTPSLPNPESGVFLSFEHWLKSEESAAKISQALRQSSQFTVGLRIAADRFDVEGPQRILSISESIVLRNMTLGQENRDLVLRLRMLLSNENGRRPELIIPNLFVDDLFHDIVITYNGAFVHVYVDDWKPQHSFELVPSIAFWMMVSPGRLEEFRSTDQSLIIFYALYDALVLLPFAALLFFMYGRLPGAKSYKILLLILLMVGFAFVWEAALHFVLSSYTITRENVWLNLIIGFAALALFAVWHWGWARQAKQTRDVSSLFG